MSWAFSTSRASERAVRPARTSRHFAERRQVTERRQTDESGSTLSLLAEAANDGDPEAFDGLLRKVSQIVHRYCRSRLMAMPGGDQSAEDAAQEACLNLIDILPQYRPSDGPFESLVFTVASRRVADQQRVAYRVPVPVAEIPDEVADHPTPEEHAVASEEADRVRELLEHLSPSQREVLTLRVAVGMSAEEVAAALDMTPGAVRVTQHRALGRLRQLMQVNQEQAVGKERIHV